MICHLHRPSRALPCGCATRPGDVTPGDTLTRRCQHATWTGTVRPSSAVDTVLVIDWTRQTVEVAR